MRGVIFWGIALLTTSALAACSGVSQIGQSSPAVSTLETIEGVAVIPTEVEQDPVGEILGMQMWTFDVTLPDSVSLDLEDGAAVSYQLELRQPGQAPEVLGSFSTTSSDQNFELLVGLHPLGNTLVQAETLQYYLRAGGLSSSGLIANPFKRFSTGTAAWSKRQPTEMKAVDNEIVLMEIGSAGRVPDPQNSLLVLKIELEESI
jgi:hypothetical protein